MIKICKTVLSGSAPGKIRDETEGLASAPLRDLAVKLAADPALTVSVITYEDGRQELEVLHTGLAPSHRAHHRPPQVHPRGRGHAGQDRVRCQPGRPPGRRRAGPGHAQGSRRALTASAGASPGRARSPR
jgi:hypothetical protein